MKNEYVYPRSQEDWYMFFGHGAKAGSVKEQRDLAVSLMIPSRRWIGLQEAPAAYKDIEDAARHMHLYNVVFVVKNVWCIGSNWPEITKKIKWLHENNFRLLIYDLHYYDSYHIDGTQLQVDTPCYAMYMELSKYIIRKPTADDKRRHDAKGPIPITLDEYPQDIINAYREYCSSIHCHKRRINDAFDDHKIKRPSKAVHQRLCRDMDSILLKEHADDPDFSVFRSANYRAAHGLPISVKDMS